MQAIVQLRGEVNVNYEVTDTLDMLNIGRVNHATLVPETDSYRGMITKVNDLVAFGEPSAETVALLISRRGEPLEGAADIDDEWVSEHTDYDDVDALAAALVDEETTLREQGLSPTLRLHAPRGGHDGIKHPVVEGGELGRHTTEEIDALLEAMR
ncbi:50S ribosomal protein L30 [Halorubrum vacuolatum]|uniref:Large ribosomal subunit protein uL30 n=1 Tax=Halorubrum vacuolatum TaxID=63740 RepID=A0A238WNS9_HALVU|nr:50S ribosomal protein L30 [Halorubrum vacuolatum]SNR48117.1 large subunit ribosomal protein L30 [Halorubrum vacuolatum]